MKIEKDEALKSGYQPRPVAPPSAGRALLVLGAVGAGLWVGLMLATWQQRLASVYHYQVAAHAGLQLWRMAPDWLLLTVQQWKDHRWFWMTVRLIWLPLVGNCLVFRWATRPLLQYDTSGPSTGNHPFGRASGAQAVVLGLCLMVHVVSAVHYFLFFLVSLIFSGWPMN